MRVTGQLNGEEIVTRITKLPDDDDDYSDKDEEDDHETFSIPAHKDVMSAINILCQYLQSRDNVPDDLFSYLIHMETLVKTSVSCIQGKLKDFF